MQIKKIENLTEEELDLRIEAIDPLCEWNCPFPTKKNIFMQRLWGMFRRAHVELYAIST